MKTYVINLKTASCCLILTFAAVFSIIIFVKCMGRNAGVTSFATDKMVYYAIIDAGHGGEDGGASSRNGVTEAPICLAISLKTHCLLNFLGIPTALTRADETSLGYNPDAAIRSNKQADLNGRLAIAREYPNCDFLSIHLNFFTQSKYSGAQVFYSPNNDMSQTLAELLQKSMRRTLDPENDRRAKMSPGGVFLMKSIQSPAVTIECGFLSNEEECIKLQQDSYQSRIAIAISIGYLEYLEVSENNAAQK